MTRLFGTDGIRGLANRDLTAQLALDVALAAAQVLRTSEAGPHGGHPVAVIGRDTRASGEFLAAAVMAGLASAGMQVYDAGVVPTPAVAFLTADLGADLGVVLSASHNPAPDNGIKLFGPGGRKLRDEVEDAIETRIGQPMELPVGAEVGRIITVADAGERYLQHLLSTMPHRLDGLTVVVDCGHGAAFAMAPEMLRRAGAQVITIGVEPTGLNINDGCGSTHLERLQAAVREHHADAGIAHDGDADRCLAVDAEGQIVDGDQIMAILALALRESGHLSKDTLVLTVMSNLGLKLAMQREGIQLVETAVGDRYVLEEMVAGGYSLGGEQSGHVIMQEHATTGDGLLTALQLLSQVAGSGKPLGELAAVMTRLPQVLVNVKNVDKSAAGTNPGVVAAVAAAEAQLGQTGRVLLRASGTEPLVRVMVEAPELELAQQVADELAEVVRQELSLG